MKWKSTGFSVWRHKTLFMALLFSSQGVTLGKSLNFSEYQFLPFKVGKEICHSCLSHGAHMKSPNSRGYINKQTWHTSLTIPLLVDDQPLGMPCTWGPCFMRPSQDPVTEVESTCLPTRSRTGISPSCQHGVETRGLIQSWCRAGSWVPALCKLLVYQGWGRREVGGILPSHLLFLSLRLHPLPPWLPLWPHVLYRR